ncbi:MAG: hypothetical protein DLM72_19205 [Candidatus Nitrosopolaris wilkensis]|nr:MAG: hypothetical protein DLM72_19205 [Candidatus Nitrosopolaris wilkensis]
MFNGTLIANFANVFSPINGAWSGFYKIITRHINTIYFAPIITDTVAWIIVALFISKRKAA